MSTMASPSDGNKSHDGDQMSCQNWFEFIKPYIPPNQDMKEYFQSFILPKEMAGNKLKLKFFLQKQEKPENFDGNQEPSTETNSESPIAMQKLPEENQEKSTGRGLQMLVTVQTLPKEYEDFLGYCHFIHEWNLVYCKECEHKLTLQGFKRHIDKHLQYKLLNPCQKEKDSAFLQAKKMYLENFLPKQRNKKNQQKKTQKQDVSGCSDELTNREKISGENINVNSNSCQKDNTEKKPRKQRKKKKSQDWKPKKKHGKLNTVTQLDVESEPSDEFTNREKNINATERMDPDHHCVENQETFLSPFNLEIDQSQSTDSSVQLADHSTRTTDNVNLWLNNHVHNLDNSFLSNATSEEKKRKDDLIERKMEQDDSSSNSFSDIQFHDSSSEIMVEKDPEQLIGLFNSNFESIKHSEHINKCVIPGSKLDLSGYVSKSSKKSHKRPWHKRKLCLQNLNFQLDSTLHEQCQSNVKFEPLETTKVLSSCNLTKRRRITSHDWKKAEERKKQDSAKDTSKEVCDKSGVHESWNKLTFTYHRPRLFPLCGMRRAESGLPLLNSRCDKLRDTFLKPIKEEFCKKPIISH